MSKLPFVCLNVEPESEDDEEIDDTAEIKLEEALKLYQQALKLHAQGPAAFDEAQEAYEELFENEVFTYDEALSYRKRQDARESQETDSESDSGSSSDQSLAQASIEELPLAAPEVAPSTLLQVIYLSYKNYGQFQLDVLQDELGRKGVAGKPLDDFEPAFRNRTINRLRKALDSFVDAVDKDDTDTDLWRQIARLTALLGSPRLTRFCLETILTANGDDLDADADDLVLKVVREDLSQIYDDIRDIVAKKQLNGAHSPKGVPLRVKKALDPCPYLPDCPGVEPSLSMPTREAKVLRLKTPSWINLGKQIIRQLKTASSPEPGFASMCMFFRIENVPETFAKPEDIRGKRRRTNDGLEMQPNGQSHAQDADVSMAGVEDQTAPSEGPESPIAHRAAAEASEVCSPVQEKALPMRTLSGDSVKDEGDTVGQINAATARDDSNPLKRSPEEAGMSQDPPEARSRSKRLRARESGIDEDSGKDLRIQLEKQLKPVRDADRHLFSVSDTLLKRLGVVSLGGADELHDLWNSELSPPVSASNELAVALSDLKASFKAWSGNKSNLLLHGTGVGATATLITKGNEAGLASFLEHAKSGQNGARDTKPALADQDLDEFIAFVNHSLFSVDELALSWLVNILGPGLKTGDTFDAHSSKYLSLKWSPELKAVVHEMLSLVDDFAFGKLNPAVMFWNGTNGTDQEECTNKLRTLLVMTQTLFEVELDMFDSMIKPTSKADQPTRTLQKARLRRWAYLGSHAISKWCNVREDQDSLDPIDLRYLFSMTLYLSLDEGSSREHIIMCLQDVKDRVEEGDDVVLSLPNLDIMPEISTEAVEQEISRLTTTDFFMSVFNPSDDDPVVTIGSLEPIILPLTQSSRARKSPRPNGAENQAGKQDVAASPSQQLMGEEHPIGSPASQKDQLSEFLSKSTASLRLSLWNRLANAYSAIDAADFVFLCTIHSIDIVLSELENPTFTTQSESTRMPNLLIWIRNLVDLVDKCCSLLVLDPKALDAMDEDNLRLALGCAATCVKLFHLFAIFEDRTRMGQSGAPPQQAGGATSFKQAMNLFRDMQVKTWRLLYMLLRDAAQQNPDLFPDVNDDFLVYIAAIHSAIGLREYCKLGKKSFVKYLKAELLSLKPADTNEWRYQMAQVAYDLYDLRVLADSNTWMMLQEHNCPADQLDRATARDILPMVMAQIQGTSVRDLIKPDRRDFKAAIDKIQELIGNPKANTVQQSFNRKQLLAFQKTAVRPSDIVNSLKGVGGLTTMPIKNDFTAIAQTGWFFIVGYLRLASFRSVKRTGPDSTKELDDAMNYLKFDIDFDSEKWETWYRLAQAYDSMLDEEVTWTADRINNKRDDLVGLQRQAIHCYQTAIALAVRQPESSTGKTEAQLKDKRLTISELYSDFGKRLYASSRPPFDMHAFSVKDHSRWFFTRSQVKFKARPFKQMTEPAVWLVASVCFRRALVDRPNDWQNWYMLGKCLWKLLGHEDVGGLSQKEVLGAFSRACEVAPNKDSKSPEKGLILEPHLKLVSAVHKLVYQRGTLTPEEGVEWLSSTPYVQKAQLDEPKGKPQWLTLAKQVIRNLHGADKANWHHRIMARAAYMAFEDEDQEQRADAAIMQLTPHIFTKTMVVQVWRTLFERAGRHFVYTTRYVNFFIDLLAMTGDRSGLDMLGRKVRKKTAEFIDHTDIWIRICREHVALLRSQEDVPAAHEENVLFVLPYETFVLNAALLQDWAQPTKGESPTHRLLTVLREAMDLKKLNSNLIPNQGIDDLIGDAYAKLYEELVPSLIANATNEKNREAMRVDRLLMADPGADERGQSGNESAVILTNPSGRAKTVGRMEVRRRVEALVQRLGPTQAPIKGRAATLAEEAAAREEADDSEEPGEDDHAETSHLEGGANSENENDADDESELSELDEEPTEDLEGEEHEHEGGDGEEEDEMEVDAEEHGNDAGRGMQAANDDAYEDAGETQRAESNVEESPDEALQSQDAVDAKIGNDQELSDVEMG